MLKATDGYKSAIVGDVRQTVIKATLEIIDPDIIYDSSNGSGAAPWSKPEQIHNKEFPELKPYATLEPGLWRLNGTYGIIPDDSTQATGEIGHVGNVMGDSEGNYDQIVYAELGFSGVSILQACSVYFSTNPTDGIPVDFRVCVMQNETTLYEKAFSGNTKYSVSLDGFTVYDPTAIRVYVSKWSLPRRRIRIPEIVPGVYEKWSDDVLASVNIEMRSNFACLAIPYNVCTLKIDNLDRRFEPRNKSGIFQSIEERQGIPVAIGTKLVDGTTEWKQVGVFYQYSGGWKTSDNAMTMTWDLVDIIGLLSRREFKAPSTLPTTLGGWIEALAAQLGENFKNKWTVDPNYADLPVLANSKEDVSGKRCGDLLRWACMASGTFPRADAATGNLTAEPFWSEGNKYDLDNMTVYPTMRANDDLAILTFRLYDENHTIVNVSGNATSSSNTLTVSNPFIHTTDQALIAARQILSQYGGNKVELYGRGNPTSEIGDVDTVWLDESNATTGRRMEQSFSFNGGVLSQCAGTLLQADGSFLFERSVVLSGSGSWTPPSGVTQLRVVLGQGAQGSTASENGKTYTYDPKFDETPPTRGRDGAPGLPGKIWHGTINVNSGVAINYLCGLGSNPREFGEVVPEGEETIFGVYTSANGKRYENGFTDINSGGSYGRSGVLKPLDGTSDGPAESPGGTNCLRRFSGYQYEYDEEGKVVDSTPVYTVTGTQGLGSEGKKGADGFILISWDKEAKT